MKDYYELKGYVSNSSLNVLEKSIREFKRFIYEDVGEESKPYFDFGTALHMYILEPERFKVDVLIHDYKGPKSKQQIDFCKAYAKLKKATPKKKKDIFLSIYKPTDKWEEKVNALVKEFKDYIKYLKERQNKLVISTEIFKQIQSISLELKRHKMASKLLSEPSIVEDKVAFNELQILWDYKGTRCKSMLDRVIVDKDNKIVYIIDLKTTSSMKEFKKSFEKFRYDRQLAFYGMALSGELPEIAGVPHDDLIAYKVVGVIIAVDKFTLEVKTFKIPEQTIDEALSEVNDLLERAKWHIDNNKFDYSKDYYEGDGFETL